MKEFIVKIGRAIKQAFTGTNECHAKLDAAIADAQPALRKAERVLAARKKPPTQEIPVANGAHG